MRVHASLTENNSCGCGRVADNDCIPMSIDSVKLTIKSIKSDWKFSKKTNLFSVLKFWTVRGERVWCLPLSREKNMKLLEIKSLLLLIAVATKLPVIVCRLISFVTRAPGSRYQSAFFLHLCRALSTPIVSMWAINVLCLASILVKVMFWSFW